MLKWLVCVVLAFSGCLGTGLSHPKDGNSHENPPIYQTTVFELRNCRSVVAHVPLDAKEVAKLIPSNVTPFPIVTLAQFQFVDGIVRATQCGEGQLTTQYIGSDQDASTGLNVSLGPLSELLVYVPALAAGFHPTGEVGYLLRAFSNNEEWTKTSRQRGLPVDEATIDWTQNAIGSNIVARTANASIQLSTEAIHFTSGANVSLETIGMYVGEVAAGWTRLGVVIQNPSTAALLQVQDARLDPLFTSVASKAAAAEEAGGGGIAGFFTPLFRETPRAGSTP